MLGNEGGKSCTLVSTQDSLCRKDMESTAVSSKPLLWQWCTHRPGLEGRALSQKGSFGDPILNTVLAPSSLSLGTCSNALTVLPRAVGPHMLSPLRFMVQVSMATHQLSGAGIHHTAHAQPPVWSADSQGMCTPYHTQTQRGQLQ